MKTIRVIFYSFIIGLIALSSCQKEEGINKPMTNNPNSFTVKMTDAPADYAQLNVEIERVEAYLENSGWVELNSQSQIINVLELTNGAEAVIAQQTGLEAGVYSEIAIYFGEENSLVVHAGGAETSFDLSSQGAVIIEIEQEIEAESEAEVLLDFNVAQSVVEAAGEYVINPVIDEVEDTETGVQGEVEAEGQAAIMLTDGEATFSAYTDANGQFLIRGMPSGTYDLIVQVAAEAEAEGEGESGGGLTLPGLPELPDGEEEGEQGGGILEATFENVTIVQGEITQMGTLIIE